MRGVGLMHVITQFSELRDIIRETGRAKITNEEIKIIFDICDGARQKLYVYIFRETELIFVMKNMDNGCCGLVDFQDLISEVKRINENNINGLKEAIDKDEFVLCADKLELKLEELITRQNHLKEMEAHMNEINREEDIKIQENIDIDTDDEEGEDEEQISYDVIDGVYFPKMEFPLTERELESVVGRFGKMRMEYIKEHQPTIYQTFLKVGMLEDIIIETDLRALEMHAELVDDYRARHQGKDFLENVQVIYRAQSIANEIVIKEIVEILL